MSVLKVKIAGQRIKYEIMKVTFSESDLQKTKGWKWEKKGNSLVFSENKLDILKDYETFDCRDLGVAIRPAGDIFYEYGKTKGKISMDNMLSAVNHPILIAVRNTNEDDGLTQTSATVYDEENTIYEYSLEVCDDDFEPSQLEIITIKDPITDEVYIVELRYDGKTMKGGTDGLSFRDPMEDKSMFILNLPKDYADALGLGENRKLDNLLRFEDFIKEDNQKVSKKSVKKVKTAKDYNEAAKDGYVKLREDYIHSFIDAHERGVEPEEEE